jgi:hypothetical protein
LEGRQDFKPRRGREEKPVTIGDHVIERAGDVPGFFTAFFIEAVQDFETWTALKVAPYSGGFLEWPPEKVKAFRAFALEMGAWEAFKQEEAKKAGGKYGR